MELIVYSAFWCSDCREAKRFLAHHKIPYKEIDIENTPGAADEVVARTGKRAIPQFVINGEWIQPYRPGEGFLYQEMSELLRVPEP
ncbi:MAG: NrdH-redoxin [Acidobacteria bacterium]|nr:MAG: NrdH-redoxin [Acidobacteriota bacterium]